MPQPLEDLHLALQVLPRGLHRLRPARRTAAGKELLRRFSREGLDRVPLALLLMQRLHDRRERAAAQHAVDIVELVDVVCRALSCGTVPEYEA